ncbi:MAG: hypothetical protein EZS28_041624 [Streblomastix strix]|uniref:Uncharacterized protein n=1 Tax=Streblomastix strix TaxID=222440 RepID=A0A5J4TY73_9EUKA|nr:MAG: hypothetical protein EZS28_041624 [Streblomastix strix]
MIIPGQKHLPENVSEFILPQKNSKQTTIAFDPVITDGIVYFEIEFLDQLNSNLYIGIADASVIFEPSKGPGNNLQ